MLIFIFFSVHRQDKSTSINMSYQKIASCRLFTAQILKEMQPLRNFSVLSVKKTKLYGSNRIATISRKMSSEGGLTDDVIAGICQEPDEATKVAE